MMAMMELMDDPRIKYSIIVLAILLSAVLFSKLLRFILNKYIESSSKLLKVDPTRLKFLKNAVSFLVYLGALIAIFYIIPSLRNIGVGLFAGAGIFAAIIGFASQAAFSNIISGIFIVIFKPFKVDDVIQVGVDYFGVVEDITLRHSVIRNFENRRIVIPNSIISAETILNSTHTETKICNFFEIRIGFGANMDHAIQIIREEAEKHPNLVDNRTEEEIADNIPKVIVRVIGIGDFSVNLRAYLWSSEPRLGFFMKCDLFKAVKERFDQEGIEIPFPYRTIVNKS